MNKYLILLLFAAILSCGRNTTAEEDFKRNCPYDLDYSGHYLRVPIDILPHQLTYHVGDTIKIQTVFSDSIYDIGTKQTFKIEGFPFIPTCLLYGFQEKSSHISGFAINDLYIDSIYKPYHWQSNRYTDGFNAYMLYEQEQYQFESQLVLKETGRYILVFSDLYYDRVASGNGDLNAEADAIRFEGQCLDDNGDPLLGFYIADMIDSGDDHLSEFEDELLYLDQEVYNGSLRFVGGNATDLLGYGSLSVQFRGYFGFEVVE